MELKESVLKHKLQFLVCFAIVLSINQKVKSEEIIIDKLEDVKIPVRSECSSDSGYAVFSNFTCFNSPAIPSSDQDEYNSQGFWSGCNVGLGKKCDFTFYRQTTAFVSSISILGYFIGDSHININIFPGNGNLTVVGERWTDDTIDLKTLEDYEYISIITITPVYLTPNQFVIIDKIVIEIQEPQTGTPTSSTSIKTTDNPTPTTIKTVPTSTQASLTTMVTTPKTTSITVNPTTQTPTTESKRKETTHSFWKFSNPIIIMVFIILPVVGFILAVSFILYYARKKQIKDKIKNEDYFEEPVYIFRGRSGRSPVTAKTFNGNTVLPNSNYTASLGPIYSEASHSAVYGYGLGQKYLPRLTKRGNELW